MNDQTFYYAKEILRQIQYADPNAMNCWGVIVGMNCFFTRIKKERAAIKMNTNGFKHKGRVDIDLTWADDYTIKFYDKKDNVINKLEEYMHRSYVVHLIFISRVDVHQSGITIYNYSYGGKLMIMKNTSLNRELIRNAD